MSSRRASRDRLAEMSVRIRTAESRLYPLVRAYATRRAAQTELRLAEQALREAPSRLPSVLRARDPHALLAVFLPGNMAIYATVLYALIPGELVGRVTIRTSASTALAVAALLEALGPELSNHITLSCESRSSFADRVRDATAIVYCGSHELAVRTAQTVDSGALFIFVGSGANPFVVMPDADICAAARSAALERSFNGGRDCLCPDVLFVHAAVLPPFVAALREELSRLPRGRLEEDRAELVPLVNEAAFNRTERYLRTHAIRVAFGGHTERATLYVSPTIIVHPVNECCDPPEFSSPVWNIVPIDSEQSLHRCLESDQLSCRVHAVTFWSSKDLAFRDFYSQAIFNGSVQESDDGNQPFGGWGGRSSFVIENGVAQHRPVLVVGELARRNRLHRQMEAVDNAATISSHDQPSDSASDLCSVSPRIIEVTTVMPRAEQLIRDCWRLLCPPIWPEDEVRSVESALHRLHEMDPKRTQHVLAAVIGGRVVGMAVCHSLFPAGAALVEYLTVDVAQAPAGTGKLLYEHLRAVSRAHGAARLWIEYDDPGSIDDEGRERWAWYARRGVYRVRWPYQQPSYSPAFAPKPMALGYDLLFAGHICTATEAVGDITAILQNVYDLLDDDPQLTSIASSIRATPTNWIVADDGQLVWGSGLRLRVMRK